jgi:hypothetical protein
MSPYRTVALALLLALACVTPADAKRSRSERALAELACDEELRYELEEAKKFRGREREERRERARRAHHACVKKAKKKR